MKIGPSAGNLAEPQIWSVNRNWFDVVMQEFYFPEDFDQEYLDELKREGKKPNYINGKNPDPVEALYSDIGLPPKLAS